jgi:hypothetical protein
VFASPELVGADELVEPPVGSEIVVPAVGPAVGELLGDELGVPDEDDDGLALASVGTRVKSTPLTSVVSTVKDFGPAGW